MPRTPAARVLLLAALVLASPALAGCLGGEDRALGMRVEAKPRDPRAGTLLVAFAEVANEGEQPVSFQEGGCNAAWRFSLTTLEGVPLTMRPPGDEPPCGDEPRAATLAPGESRSASLTWNVTFWDAQARVYRPLPHGDYRVWAAFSYATPGRDEAQEISRFAPIVVRPP